MSLQGPHQSAQKPTRTGRSEERTSSENLSCVMICTLQDVSMAQERWEREEKGRRGSFSFGRSFDLLLALGWGNDEKEREDVVDINVDIWLLVTSWISIHLFVFARVAP